MTTHPITDIPTGITQRTLFQHESPPASGPIEISNSKFPDKETSLYGSFRDSMKAPVHRWFAYPAGYSYKLVEAKIREHGLNDQSWIADPFLGTGTTSVASKVSGINSLGIEAHPFVFEVAKTKINFDYKTNLLARELEEVIRTARMKYNNKFDYDNVWPDLIYKCFTDDNLRQLYVLRSTITDSLLSKENKNFFKLALTATLRVVTTAGAGWPYIAPSKYAERTVSRDAFDEFSKRCLLMMADVKQIKMLSKNNNSKHSLIQGDARLFARYAEEASVDLILTSPPYLNNYDYADRTRLETYFWGIYNSWGEITREVRNNLITAATTQITRKAMSDYLECPGIRKVSPNIHAELDEIIQRLSELRLQKSGKKSYDLLVAGYFEDMLKTIMGAFQILKRGGAFILVLGDSAPYGVHVRTDEIVGRLAKAVGFSKYDIEILRTRGGKWGHNPQRHKVPLRESILTITK